ncbi:MAG: nitroreductase family protein [Bacteroidetes bacterium]|nr:MAG: nitroreductase family protein [Bacteroidota bacterium]
MTETKEIEGFPYLSYSPAEFSDVQILERAKAFYQAMDSRRSVREFSSEPIAKEVIEQLILTASSAPSGAHKQPWTFCVVSDPELKKQIREAAEEEEYRSYNGRMSEEWLKDLAPLGTDWRKPFLEKAPYLIVVFKRVYELEPAGPKHQNYYVNESVGLACGFLLAAIHQAGLVSLTHTPSPMSFLTQLLKRPENERPFLLIPVSKPAKEIWVPDIKRKSISEMSTWY